MAGVPDLVAAEAKYHWKCYVKVARNAEKTEAENMSEDVLDPVCFHQVIRELDVELKAGNTLSTRSVWNRYIELLSSNDTACSSDLHDPDSNILGAFRNRLKEHFGESIDIVPNKRKQDSLLILPTLSKQVSVKILLDTTQESEVKQAEKNLESVFSVDEETNLGRPMYHIVNRIRSDMQDITGYTEYDIVDSNHTRNLIPRSLFLLVSMFVGGK